MSKPQTNCLGCEAPTFKALCDKCYLEATEKKLTEINNELERQHIERKAEIKELQVLRTENEKLMAENEFWKDVAEKNGAAGVKYVDQQLEIHRLREALERIITEPHHDTCKGRENRTSVNWNETACDCHRAIARAALQAAGEREE